MAVKTTSCCFPHAGGDVSGSSLWFMPTREFSPRRWGCFRHPAGLPKSVQVFPTQVGMFPSQPTISKILNGFPHAGGDVSDKGIRETQQRKFSPRRWGCFRYLTCRRCQKTVFPTQVGMFPAARRARLRAVCFPHAGGDVSEADRMIARVKSFSPRRWGCFQQTTLASMQSIGFPHAGGDVSVAHDFLNRELQFSPRRWGCFCEGLRSCR